MNLGDHITLLREAKGWTQQRLADKAGVTRSSVAYLEAKGDSRTVTARKICDALGVGFGILEGGK